MNNEIAPVIVTRAEATALGLKRYFLGPDHPCPKGHVDERLVSSRQCLACSAIAKSLRQKRQRAENPELVKSYYTKRYAENSAKIIARNAAWREANRDKDRKTSLSWAAKNKERRAVTQANRRFRQACAEGTHTLADIQEIYANQGGICPYCRVFVGSDFHVDHVMPLKLGGTNDRGNLQITCPPCNMRKGDTHPAEFTKLYEEREEAKNAARRKVPEC